MKPSDNNTTTADNSDLDSTSNEPRRARLPGEPLQRGVSPEVVAFLRDYGTSLIVNDEIDGPLGIGHFLEIIQELRLQQVNGPVVLDEFRDEWTRDGRQMNLFLRPQAEPHENLPPALPGEPLPGIVEPWPGEEALRSCWQAIKNAFSQAWGYFAAVADHEPGPDIMVQAMNARFDPEIEARLHQLIQNGGAEFTAIGNFGAIAYNSVVDNELVLRAARSRHMPAYPRQVFERLNQVLTDNPDQIEQVNTISSLVAHGIIFFAIHEGQPHLFINNFNEVTRHLIILRDFATLLEAPIYMLNNDAYVEIEINDVPEAGPTTDTASTHSDNARAGAGVPEDEPDSFPFLGALTEEMLQGLIEYGDVSVKTVGDKTYLVNLNNLDPFSFGLADTAKENGWKLVTKEEFAGIIQQAAPAAAAGSSAGPDAVHADGASVEDDIDERGAILSVFGNSEDPRLGDHSPSSTMGDVVPS